MARGGSDAEPVPIEVGQPWPFPLPDDGDALVMMDGDGIDLLVMTDGATRKEALAIRQGEMRYGMCLPVEEAVPFVMIDFPEVDLGFYTPINVLREPAERPKASGGNRGNLSTLYWVDRGTVQGMRAMDLAPAFVAQLEAACKRQAETYGTAAEADAAVARMIVALETGSTVDQPFDMWIVPGVSAPNAGGRRRRPGRRSSRHGDGGDSAGPSSSNPRETGRSRERDRKPPPNRPTDAHGQARNGGSPGADMREARPSASGADRESGPDGRTDKRRNGQLIPPCGPGFVLDRQGARKTIRKTLAALVERNGRRPTGYELYVEAGVGTLPLATLILRDWCVKHGAERAPLEASLLRETAEYLYEWSGRIPTEEDVMDCSCIWDRETASMVLRDLRKGGGVPGAGSDAGRDGTA